MKKTHPTQTLRMLVRQEWLVETITMLGSGYITHLAYPKEVIAPEVLQELENRTLNPGMMGEIVYRAEKGLRRVAWVEVFGINDFESFIRFDLRLLEVGAFVKTSGETENEINEIIEELQYNVILH